MPQFSLFWPHLLSFTALPAPIEQIKPKLLQLTKVLPQTLHFSPQRNPFLYEHVHVYERTCVWVDAHTST